MGNPSGYILPAAARRGAPPAYKLKAADGAQDYVGYTLMQLARDGAKKRLVPKAVMSAGDKLVWLTGCAFKWRFPEHLRLCLELVELERDGCTTEAGSGLKRRDVVISAEHARAAYSKCARRAPHCHNAKQADSALR